MGDYYHPPSRDGLVLKKRSEVRPGEIIVGRALPSTQLARRRDYDQDHNDDVYNRSPRSTQALARRLAMNRTTTMATTVKHLLPSALDAAAASSVHDPKTAANINDSTLPNHPPT